MTVHHLKVQDPYYTALKDGSKRFEVRKNDRAFQAGDILHLHYYDPSLCRRQHRGQSDETVRTHCPAYLGSSATFEVTFVYSGDPRFGGIEPGYVVLSLEEVDES